ncbi:MAG: sigma-70 family RNA polymerase sigma factor, partial [Planctomycetes bacterium]|nr:sigma-70 family RNA polymerase sigma factor [Planctomycetota bacterium]
MQHIKNENIAQLLMQMRFMPEKQRRKQLNAAEKLLTIIDNKKQYPFDFVCFHITEFNPKIPTEQQLINGDELAGDLQIFIAKLSSQFAMPAAEQKQKVYSIEELAAKFEVATKTIHRWRKRGLIARKFIFQDGKKRFGFLQSSIDNFLKANPSTITKAKKFTRLTNKEKQKIIKQAATLAKNRRMSKYQIIEKISTKTGKAHETIRYTILNYEKQYPDKPVFNSSANTIDPTQAAKLYKMFKQGCNITELMERFGRSKSSIYRIINIKRAKMLMAKKIDFIASDEFLNKNAGKEILAKLTRWQKSTIKKNNLPSKHLQALKNTPVLNRDDEIRWFKKYNYLKYLTWHICKNINLSHVSGREIKKAENYLAKAETIKKMIIEANMRLVVSIANKHTISGANLFDLVSEGNFSLMRAVEKFDYAKGFRFSTYASWVIAKDFARKIPTDKLKAAKETADYPANIQRDFRIEPAVDFAAIERAQKNLIEVIRDNLDKREQYIILNHFGLLGTLVKKKKKTLKQIGDNLD